MRVTRLRSKIDGQTRDLNTSPRDGDAPTPTKSPLKRATKADAEKEPASPTSTRKSVGRPRKSTKPPEALTRAPVMIFSNPSKPLRPTVTKQLARTGSIVMVRAPRSRRSSVRPVMPKQHRRRFHTPRKAVTQSASSALRRRSETVASHDYEESTLCERSNCRTSAVHLCLTLHAILRANLLLLDTRNFGSYAHFEQIASLCAFILHYLLRNQQRDTCAHTNSCQIAPSGTLRQSHRLRPGMSGY